jgi:hypothetical protein
VRIGLEKTLGVHELRKLALAQAGASTHDMAAVSGHPSLQMAAHDTRSVDPARLAGDDNQLSDRARDEKQSCG